MAEHEAFDAEAESHDLDNAYRINLTDYCEPCHLDRLMEEIKPQLEGLGRVSVVERNARFLLLGLIASRYAGKEYLSFPRGNSTWSAFTSGMNPSDISSTLTKVVDKFIKLGWVEQFKGYQNRAYGGRGSRWSRIRTLQPLSQLLDRYSPPYHLVIQHPNTPRILVRNEAKQAVYLKTRTALKEIARMEEQLEAYNSLISRTEIGITGSDVFYLQRQKATYRVFNRSSLSHGGRFYGGWWEQMKKEHRPFITINGAPTVELDYSAQHPHLLYGLYAGVSYQEGALPNQPKDAYTFGSHPREVNKALLLKLISAKSVEEAASSTKLEFNRRLTQAKESNNRQAAALWGPIAFCFDNPTFFKDILETEIRQAHEPIYPYFATDLGTKLMRVDSTVAEFILREMTEVELPVLCVHDSFICREEDAPTLNTIMKRAYLEQSYGDESLALSLPPIKITKKDEGSRIYIVT